MKKLLLTFLVLALTVSLIPLQADAETLQEGDFQYEHFYNEGVIITDYTGSGGDVAIPSTLGGYPVTSIMGHAFDNCPGLTSVTIPDSVIGIGNNVFYNCDGLTSVTLGKGIASIDKSAFSGCPNLTDVYIADTSALWKNRFSEDYIDTMSYADNLHILDKNGNEITEIVWDETIPEIPEYAFYKCAGLTSVTIPDSVTSIGSWAFSGCSGLTSITIPDSVTSIGSWAFSGCSGLTSITIPDSVTTIEASVFTDCSGLTSITIPDSVTTIEAGAFMYCTSLTSVTIPEGITTIKSGSNNKHNGTFVGCTALEEITIPVSMFSIDDNAFVDVPLKTVHYAGTEEQWNKIDLNNNACFATAEIKFSNSNVDNDETDADGPENAPKKSNTVYIVVIVILSVALAASWVYFIIDKKKR